MGRRPESASKGGRILPGMASTTFPELIVSRQLRRQGDSTQYVERGSQTGVFVRIRPGVYLPTALWDALDPAARHRMRMEALLATSRHSVVFSHESAAAVHGIPIVGAWPDLPRVVEPLDAGRKGRTGVVIRRVEYEQDVCRVDEFWATSAVRTALDLAAVRSLVAGVVAIDHVIHQLGEQGRQEFVTRVDPERAFRGVRKVRAALEYATGKAESPLESLSLVRFRELGFVAPEQQTEFVVDGETFRVDFWWPDAGIIGEADGTAKYGADGSIAIKRVLEEKRREDALRSVSAGFARWSWSDAWDGDPLAAHLRRAGVPQLRPFASRSTFNK